MFYYEIFISSPRYHKLDALTYCSNESLLPGQIVIVSLQQKLVPGYVSKSVSAPRFATQHIARAVSDVALPMPLPKVAEWLRTYYPAPGGLITSLIVPTMLLQKSRKQPEPLIYEDSPVVPALPPLTLEQSTALEQLGLPETSRAILHGDTGTGKTRIYLERVRKVISQGKSAIILTPEIGLTPQLTHIFEAHFTNQVIILHSALTPANRRQIWLKCLEASLPLVIIGPRSALFAPLSNVGIIILDEVHDGAYKQEQAPYYQASRVAATLAGLHHAQLIMGSATPLVGDYYVFQSKKLPIIRLRQSAISSTEKVRSIIVSLHDRQLFNRSPLLSDTLLEEFGSALSKGEQALCFLNRRGTARMMVCADCGWEASCPRCDLPLTFHADHHLLRCHTCGHHQVPPTVCPACGATDISFRSAGTKALMHELQRLLPQARLGRFDSDTKVADSLAQTYQQVRDGQIDILVGTQLISKGLDLPKLSVVGIVSGDTSLSFPDYTAEEHTFQMLTQVMGRVGRGHGRATIVVQTHHPESSTLRAALQKNYETFYEHEIQERKRYNLPPFKFILKLRCSRKQSRRAEIAASELAAQLQEQKLPIAILGPAPAFIGKTQDYYHWQLIIKSSQRSLLCDIIARLPASWHYDLDPLDLL